MPHLLPHALLLSLLLSACSTPLETVAVPAPVDGWVVAHAQDEAGSGNITEFVPDGETLANWSEMITIQFLENVRTPPQDFMAQLEGAMKARVPSVTWQVIAGNDDSVLYEWYFAGVPDFPDQHEIARLMRGNDGLHRAAYTKRGARLAEQEREQWLGYLRGAVVEKDGKPITVR